MLPNVEALARLLIATEADRDELAWPAIEREWGCVFPADYKEFLDLFGAGDFGDYLGVMAPFPRDHEAYKAGMRMVRLESAMLEELDCPFPAYPAEGGVIAFGATPNGDSLLYKTAQEPGNWRIVTWSRAGGRWTEHEHGFVDFVLALLHAQLEDNPFGGRDLWGTQITSYRHWNQPRH